MKIKNHGIKNLLKINSDLDMLITLILKNTVLEILEVVEDNLQEKQRVESRLELLLELF